MLISQDDLICLLRERGIGINGVLHIGAHDCEELGFYRRLGLADHDCYWIDAIKEKVDEVTARGIPNVYQAVVSDRAGETVTFHITNNVQSSSILEFGTHAESYDWVVVTKNVSLQTSTVQSWVSEYEVPISKLNFWNLDIQGAELLALKGAGDLLRHADVLYLEVNTCEVYKGCAKMWELDEMLLPLGFCRALTKMWNDTDGWGDAVYVREKSFGLAKTMIAFDIGANIGAWSLANADRFKQIVAIEASPRTFARLKDMVSVRPEIVPVNVAVSNNNGRDIVFYEADADTLSTTNREWLTAPSSRFCGVGHRAITCKTTTIDALIDLYGVPDLIKIDVEGAELDCVTSLTRHVDTLCFEWASEMMETTRMCITYLESIGFTRFCIQHGDNYTFRPSECDYGGPDQVVALLGSMVPKVDWGMVWCR